MGKTGIFYFSVSKEVSSPWLPSNFHFTELATLCQVAKLNFKNILTTNYHEFLKAFWSRSHKLTFSFLRISLENFSEAKTSVLIGCKLQQLLIAQ